MIKPITYFYVSTYGCEWKVVGAAYAGRNVFPSRNAAVSLARHWAMNVHKMAGRPTGVRVQLEGSDPEGNPRWADDTVFGL